ncbi:hypothetical protein [Actinoplanes sp. NPDC020271]|uniref:hypothetical protein n=1 Tax=Actinoplanes sp. NPDC020271 TaxID=3363896 RepID=UPI0037ACD71A
MLVEFTHAADSVPLPAGRVVDEVCGVAATLIASVVVVAASPWGVSGSGTPARPEYDHGLCARVEALRMKEGPMLGRGDVSV